MDLKLRPNNFAFKLQKASNIPQRVKTRMLDASAKTAFNAVKRNLMGPYSLAALKRMGHPYAVKHGSIIVSPPNRVNRQSGDMIRSLTLKRGGGIRKLYFDDSIAPHAKWVLAGTPRMLPRDVFGSAITKRTITFMNKAAKKHFMNWFNTTRVK